MTTNKKSQDLFSNFVNWFAAVGNDNPPIDRKANDQDLFSKLMNKLSN